MSLPTDIPSYLDLHADGTVQLLKVIANPHRLMILHRLRQSEATVSQLEKHLSMSQPALSQHLARMRQEGILHGRRHGQYIYYSICEPRIHRLLPVLEQLFEDSSVAAA
jgi:ArsR family transcriptional regulator, virulence genes transcriptional regulator